MATDTATDSGSVGTSADTELGLSPGIEAVLGYLFGFIGGLLLLAIEDNDLIEHHAAQSVLLSVTVFVLSIVINVFLGVVGLISGTLATLLGLLTNLLWLAVFAVTVFLMVKAYIEEYYRLPVLGDYIEDVADLI